MDVLSSYDAVVIERASIDEAYVDLTQHVKLYLEKKFPNPENDPIACLNAIDKTYLEGSFPFGFESSTAWFEHLESTELIQFEDVKLAVGAEIVGRMRKDILEKTGFKCSAGIAHNKVMLMETGNSVGALIQGHYLIQCGIETFTGVGKVGCWNA